MAQSCWSCLNLKGDRRSTEAPLPRAFSENGEPAELPSSSHILPSSTMINSSQKNHLWWLVYMSVILQVWLHSKTSFKKMFLLVWESNIKKSSKPKIVILSQSKVPNLIKLKSHFKFWQHKAMTPIQTPQPPFEPFNCSLVERLTCSTHSKCLG